MSQLRSVTCHLGSHSVTFYPTQVSTPRLHPGQSGRYSIYLPRRDRRLSWPRWLVTYRDATHPSTNKIDIKLSSNNMMSVRSSACYISNAVANWLLKACPHQATNCCRKRQQIVARNGNIVAAPVKVVVYGNNLLPFSATKLPFSATICCSFCCRVWTGLYWLQRQTMTLQSYHVRGEWHRLNVTGLALKVTYAAWLRQSM